MVSAGWIRCIGTNSGTVAGDYRKPDFPSVSPALLQSSLLAMLVRLSVTMWRKYASFASE